MKSLRVLSLFDGMSCGQIALRELGIPIDAYYASEVDKFAIQQTQLNFPNTIQLGDVRNVDVKSVCEGGNIDLLIGGSPCQSFSFAGKRVGMKTTENEEIYTLERYLRLKQEGFEFEGQSYLFWEYMRILKELRRYNPNVLFLLENVEMGKKWERVLSEAIGIRGVHINSALVSAQNRRRIYWTNIRVGYSGIFGEPYTDIPQPADRGILLRDILENEVDEKYFLSKNVVNRITGRDRFNVKKLKCANDKGSAVMQSGSGNNSDMDLICVAMRGRNPENPSSRKAGIKTVQMLEPVEEGKTNCLTSVAKDNLIAYGLPDDQFCLNKKRNELGRQIRKEYEAGTIKARRSDLVDYAPREDDKTGAITTVQSDNLIAQNSHLQNNLTDVNGKSNSFLATSGKGAWANGMTLVRTPIQLNESTESGGKQPYQQNRVYDVNGLAPAVMANLSCGSYAIYENMRIRRITPTECARLQTIPEWYKWECSETQQYRMLGNGWTVEVIKHIFSFMDIK